MDVKPSWVVPTKPPVKRTYQSKFKVHNKGPGVTDTLLSRAVWCYDALFGRQPLSPGAGSVGSDATAARDEIDSILPTFSRLSLEAPPPISLAPSISPQTVSSFVRSPIGAPKDCTPTSPVSVESPALPSSPAIISSPATPPSFPSSHAKHVIAFLPISDIGSSTLYLNKQWSATSIGELSLRCSDVRSPTVTIRPLPSVMAAYPWGCFLSDGAFKKVFKCWNKITNRCEAVSVMNIPAILGMGNDHVISQEIRMGCLASDLVQTGACVNFIQVFRIFQAEGGPDESVWGSETERAPQGTSPPTTAASAPAAVRASAKGKPKKRKGKLEAHLYIAMELCDWGSVEDMLRVLEADVLSSASVDPGLALVKPFMFQMAVSLAVATAKLSMLHGDIKLLNFMLMRNSTTHLTYSTDALSKPCTLPCDVIVKLGDFGTAIQLAGASQLVSLQSYTTFENTPPEYLYGGDGIVKDYSADAWCLGLCFLHLLTGCCPYEEVMESIQCPDTLLAQLNTVWSTPGAESMSFDTLGQALECDDDNILATTLYRQVVLLGLPTAADLEAAGHGNNPVWKLLLTSLSADGAGGRKKPTKAAAALQAQYRADCALCSLSHGSHELMQRCRRRMAALPGCEQLLRSLLHWFPSTRASLASVPTSPMFDY